MLTNNLKAFPQTEELEYRQKIDSKQLNTIINSLEESILRAVLRGNDFSSYLSKLQLAIVKSNLAFNNRPNTDVTIHPTSSVYTGYASAYDTGVVASGLAKDLICGQITLNYTEDTKFCKTPRDSDGKATSSVTILVDDVIRDYTDNCYDCLNKSGDSFWIEEVSDTTQKTIEFQYPASADSRFNYIRINPFPVYGFEINSIKYQDMNGGWNELPFKNNTNEPITIHCAPKEYNGNIKLTITPIDNILAIGFSLIDVAFIDYENENSIYLRIPIDNTTTFSKLNLQSFRLYYDMDIDESINISEYISGMKLVYKLNNNYLDLISAIEGFNNTYSSGIISNIVTELNKKAVYLKLSLKEYNRTTPIIRGAKITYKKVS